MRLIFPLNFLTNKNNEFYHKPKKIMSSKEVLNGWKILKGYKMQVIN
mgnify:CR=1 FL=1